MNFTANLILGMSEGAASGVLNAALWGDNIGKGALYGAAHGGLASTLAFENMSNLLNGEGFFTNSNVFERMINRGLGKQDMLNYFGFDGIYDPNITSASYSGGEYWGMTSKDGTIFYGDLAFENYASLKGTYIKESFHANRIKSGAGWNLLSESYPRTMKLHLGEIDGYNFAYKQQGLFLGHTIPFNTSIKRFTDELSVFEVPYKSYPQYFKWIYKIPRRW